MFEKILDKLQERVAMADGGLMPAKRGLVDGPGGYAGKQEPGVYLKRPGQYYVRLQKGGKKLNQAGLTLEEANKLSREFQEKTKNIQSLVQQRYKNIDPEKLTMLNKYSQKFFQKQFKDLTNQSEKDKVQKYYARSPNVLDITSEKSPLTKEQQNLIKKAYPDTELKFGPNQKLGVPFKIGSKTNPEYTSISNFVKRGYQKTVKDMLPLDVQKKIVAKFSLPPGVQEWDFEKYKYGLPETKTTNMNLGKRIVNYINDPKQFKVSADFGSPQGWMMGQMERAYRNGNKNYIPKKTIINGKKIIVGFTDNSEFGKSEFGKNRTYFSTKKYAKKFGGVLMGGNDNKKLDHPDFENTKKYFNIAKRVHNSPNEAITKILTKGGVQNDRITLNSLLNYMINEKGVRQTERALVLHHRSGVASRPTGDYQLLNRLVNAKIRGVEGLMRTDSKNITPENIKFLKDAGASVVINGKRYGGGPTTALGGLRAVENFVQGNLQGYNKVDWKNLQKAFNQGKNIPGMSTPMKAFLTTAAVGAGAAFDKFKGKPDEVQTAEMSPGATAASVTAAAAATTPTVRQGAMETLSKTAQGVKDIYQKAKQTPYLGKGIELGKKGLGFLLNKVLVPAAAGTVVYDLGEKAQYETPEDFALTNLQQPLDFIGAGGVIDAIKRKGQLERYATPEEKEVIKQYYTPQYDVLGTDETDYIPTETSQEVKDQIEGIYDKYLRKEFGPARQFEPYSGSNVFVDTGDKPFYIEPEAEKRYEEREKQGLASLGDIYGP
jgi:hypothetical protein